MQTFLPLPDFHESARVLDRLRLGKQRVEVLQLLNALTGTSRGWANHPAAKMWRGHEGALAAYGIAMCDEWISRGYKDTTRERLLTFLAGRDTSAPSWMGDEAFHAAHRSKLLAKNYSHYAAFGWTEEPGMEYVWPAVTETENAL